jgi:hypothetical protein
MDRRVAAFAGILFLAAFAGFQSPGSGSGVPRGSTPKSPASSSEKNSIVLPLSELGPWEASCDFFQPDPANAQFEGPNNGPGLSVQLTRDVDHQLRALDKQVKGIIDPRTRWCLPANSQSPEFLIVTVPDPVNSHLALEFDRRMDSIVWAATDAGYINDQFWLPWDPEDGTSKSSDDPVKARTETMLAEVRQSQPGLLIFRSSQKNDSRPLFVFLVGETPTNGLSKEQFRNALEYIPIIAADKNALSNPDTRILGPSFSGSVHSLLQVLSGYPCNHCFHVIPSSATDRDALDAISGANIVRKEILHDDSIANASFLCYAQAKLQIEPQAVAILSESETAFGSALYDPEYTSDADHPEYQFRNASTDGRSGRQSADPCGTDRVTRLRFPREIASLRNAYPDQPVSSSPQPALGKQPEAPFLGLPLRLRDQAHQVTPDSVPEFSGEQIPLSQEAVLYQIAATIRRKKIKLIEIRATNIFDTLFLASFLRESCPDARLAVLDADLLLIRATSTIPLEGTLSVSTYPLISLNQGWTDAGQGAHLTLNFASQATQAAYNGFLALMSESNPDLIRRLRDYQSPDLNHPAVHPPLWLSAVGRNGFIPIGLIPEVNPGPANPQQSSWWTGKRLPPRGYSLPSPSGGYLFLASATLVFALFGHAFGISQRTNPRGPFPQWWLDDFNVEGDEERGQKLYFLLAATLTVVAACVLTSLPIWVYASTADRTGWLPSWFDYFAVLSLITTVVLIVQGYRLHREALAANPPPDPRLPWSAWVMLALVLCPWIGITFTARSGMRSEFFVYRMIEMASGISPLVPVLFLVCAFYCWTWVHLRRVRYWELRRTAVPTIKLDAEFQLGMTDKVDELDYDLRNIRVQGRLLLVVLSATFALMILSRVRHHVAGLEPFVVFHGGLNHFNWIILFLLFWLWSFVFACWVRFIHCWYLLQIILGRLERTMLRRAFDLLPKRFYSWTPLWHAFGGRRSFVVLTRSRECLEKLLQERHDDVLDFSELRAQESRQDSLFTRLNMFFAAEASGTLNLSTCLHNINVRLCQIAEDIVEKLLPYWREQGASDTLEEIQSGTKDTEEHQLPDQIILAEEFVVLRYMTFIRYVSLQLRNLLSFIMVGFMLGVFALRSYPFLASRAIGWTLSLIFAALGTGVVVVFAEMSKDAILSRIADTDPGKISADFYFRIVSFGALPVLTLLASQFPSIGRFVFSWIQPGIEALH